ncbi:MAG: tetratricopeptide (TPR) repeat protein [Planctomycetota bacterium]
MKALLLSLAPILLVATQDLTNDGEAPLLVQAASDEVIDVNAILSSGKNIIEITRVDGVSLSTIVVNDYSLRQLLTEVTKQLGLELEGFQDIDRNALVSADLRNRKLRQSLEFILGSVGLRYTMRSNALTVIKDQYDSLPKNQLLQVASAAFFRAQREYPGHPLAADARISQGRIEEIRDNWVGALEHYQEVRASYATSPRLAEAIYGAGRMNLQMRQWSESSLIYRELINLQTNHDFRSQGLKGLTRCLIELKDFDTALHTLSVLEKSFPGADIEDRRERLFLHSDALLGVGDSVESLRILEKLQGSGLEGEQLQMVHKHRARAFESLEMTSEAGRAWLLYAQEATGQERTSAMVKAAQLALRAGDELAVLFIAFKVDSEETEEALAPYILEATERMGLPTTGDLEDLTGEERIDLAEEHIQAERYAAAKLALVDLLVMREGLPNNLRLRLVIGWSTILGEFADYQAVITFLSQERPFIEKISDRSQLDIRAADVLEQNGFIEDAIKAFEGDY